MGNQAGGAVTAADRLLADRALPRLGEISPRCGGIDGSTVESLRDQHL